MRPTATQGVDRSQPAALVILVAIACEFLGCDARPSPDRLVVATSWSQADRRRLESELAAWIAGPVSSRPADAGAVRLDWVVLQPGEDPARLAGRRSPPDVLLGGPASSYERLDRMGRLAPLPLDAAPSWSVARRAIIRLAGAPSRPRRGRPSEATDRDGPIVSFDDPRNDPICLAGAKGWLGGRRFGAGYSRLVREAGHPRRIGRRSGAAAAAAERGEIEWAPAAVPESLGASSGPEVEAVAQSPPVSWI